jgi:hypothetical protein
MSTMPTFDIETLTAGLPVSKRAAAAAFLTQAMFLESALIQGNAFNNMPLVEFYFSRGRAFSYAPFTAEEIEVIRGLSALEIHYLRPGACFRNAALVAQNVPGLKYVEGIGIRCGGAALHSWLELNGKVVDVTWPIKDDDRPSRRLDKMLLRVEHNLRHCHYYGITIPIERVRRTVIARGYFDSVIGEEGWRSRRPR